MLLKEIHKKLYKNSDTFFYRTQTELNLLKEKVDFLTNYLTAQELKWLGVESDGDCWFHAILAGLSEEKKNEFGQNETERVQKLRNLLAPKLSDERGDVVRQMRSWVDDAEGKLLASDLNMPIRFIYYAENSAIDTIYYPNHTPQSWTNELSNSNHITIIDLDGHFVAAVPNIIPLEDDENILEENEHDIFEDVLLQKYSAIFTESGKNSAFHAILGTKKDEKYVDLDAEQHRIALNINHNENLSLAEIECLARQNALTIYLHQGIDILVFNPDPNKPIHILLTEEGCYERMEFEELSKQNIDFIIQLIKHRKKAEAYKKKQGNISEDDFSITIDGKKKLENIENISKSDVIQKLSFKTRSIMIDNPNEFFGQDENGEFFIKIPFTREDIRPEVYTYALIGLEAIKQEKFPLAQEIFQKLKIEDNLEKWLFEKLYKINNNKRFFTIVNEPTYSAIIYARALLYMCPENHEYHIACWKELSKEHGLTADNAFIDIDMKEHRFLLNNACMCPGLSVEKKRLYHTIYVEPYFKALRENKGGVEFPNILEMHIFWEFLFNLQKKAMEQLDYTAYKSFFLSFSSAYFECLSGNHQTAIENISDFIHMIGFIEKTPKTQRENEERKLHKQLTTYCFYLHLLREPPLTDESPTLQYIKNIVFAHIEYEELLVLYFQFCIKTESFNAFYQVIDSIHHKDEANAFPYLEIYALLAKFISKNDLIALKQAICKVTNVDIDSNIKLCIAMNAVAFLEEETNYNHACEIFKQIQDTLEDSYLPDKHLLFYWAATVFLKDYKQASQILGYVSEHEKQEVARALQKKYVDENCRNAILNFLGVSVVTEEKSNDLPKTIPVKIEKIEKISNVPDKGRFDHKHLNSKLWDAILDTYLPIVLLKAEGKSIDNNLGNKDINISLDKLEQEGIDQDAIRIIGNIIPQEIQSSLRIDFQRWTSFALPATDAYSMTMPMTYNHIAVQWGTGSKKTGGAYAGIFVQAKANFSIKHYREALDQSKKNESNVIMYQNEDKQVCIRLVLSLSKIIILDKILTEDFSPSSSSSSFFGNSKNQVNKANTNKQANNQSFTKK